MKYFATFSSASCFLNGVNTYNSLKEAVKDIVEICKAENVNRCNWEVWDEDYVIVAAGYTQNNRNYKRPDLVGGYR